MNFHHIFQGWSNLAFPKEDIRQFLEDLREERLNHCRQCEYGTTDINIASTCKHCGCFLKAKASCTDCSCPIGKWVATATSEQDEIIQNALK